MDVKKYTYTDVCIDVRACARCKNKIYAYHIF